MARDSYSFLHFPMVAGVVLIALGMKKTIAHVEEPLDPGDRVRAGRRPGDLPARPHRVPAGATSTRSTSSAWCSRWRCARSSRSPTSRTPSSPSRSSTVAMVALIAYEAIHFAEAQRPDPPPGSRDPAARASRGRPMAGAHARRVPPARAVRGGRRRSSARALVACGSTSSTARSGSMPEMSRWNRSVRASSSSAWLVRSAWRGAVADAAEHAAAEDVDAGRVALLDGEDADEARLRCGGQPRVLVAEVVDRRRAAIARPSRRSRRRGRG